MTSFVDVRNMVGWVARTGPEPIIAGDARTESMRISGVYQEGDVDGFVGTITHYLPLRAHVRANGTVVLTYQASSPAASGPPTRR